MRRDGNQYNSGILYLKASGITSNVMWLDLATAAGNVAAPTGTVITFAGATAPEGWLDCDGSAVLRTTYAPLFAVIGSTYGDGDGSTTFNLPDLRGRAAVGLRHLRRPPRCVDSGGERRSCRRLSATEASPYAA